MPKQTVESLVEGGKATAAPPLGPALGPLGVNIGQIVAEINKKTASFKGMQVPVKVIVDSDTKAFEIEVGTPPASSLILKEAGLEKGSSNPLADKVADLRIEQVIRVAKMKEGKLLGKTLKEKIKEVLGTCNSMGILVEGKPARETIADVNEGMFAKEIKEEKTELSAEELQELAREKKKLAEDIEKRRGEFVATANQIIGSMAGKERGAIKAKLVQAGVPSVIIEELLPVEAAGEGKEKGKAPAAAAAKPEAGKAEAKPKAEGKK